MVSAAAATINVPAGGDLQAAIDTAQPGDVILLASGASFTGTYRLTKKAGDAFITIRTDAPGGTLPGPGVRITPEQSPRLAKIKAPGTSSAALVTAEGAHHWRIELVEFVGNGGVELVSLGNGTTQTQASQAPHNLIFDRVYVHGDPVLGQRRGISLNGGATQVINSYISDIKTVGSDSQALCGWNGSGPFLIENNYLEAAGENVMFGGADPVTVDLVPSDITVRRNYMTKPVAWRQEKWTVKNAFELKNARRVLVEGNVFENVWEMGQTGFAILFTTRNQSGKAPWSVVEDVTFRYNVIRHAGGAINISGFDDIRSSQQTRRISISQNLVCGIDAKAWGGSGRFLQVGNQPRDIVVEKNTVLQSGTFVHAYGKPIEGFVLRNNMGRHNSYGIMGDGQAVGNASINTYFPNGVIDRNVLAGGKASNYPGTNYFPSVTEYEASFASLVDENFALVAGSGYRTAASDGGALGADVGVITTTMRTVSSAIAPVPAPAPAPLPEVPDTLPMSEPLILSYLSHGASRVPPPGASGTARR